MAGPIHPRLLRRARATRAFLVATVAVGLLTAGLLIAQARLLADWITRAFAERAFPEGWPTALALLLAQTGTIDEAVDQARMAVRLAYLFEGRYEATLEKLLQAQQASRSPQNAAQTSGSLTDK